MTGSTTKYRRTLHFGLLVAADGLGISFAALRTMVGAIHNPKAMSKVGGDVLIVEDEVVSRRALFILLRVSGYTARAVGSAEEALDLLNDSPRQPTFALVDLDLPGMSGLEFIAKLAASNPATQSVLITAASPEDPEVRRRGDVAYLRKPIGFQDLLSILSNSTTRH